MDFTDKGDVEMYTTNMGGIGMEFSKEVTMSNTNDVDETKESMDVVMEATTSKDHCKSSETYLDPTENDSLHIDVWNRLIGRIQQKKEEL
jgi:hypothetical protein